MPDAAWVGSPPIRFTRYIRQAPTAPQHLFLYLDDEEALYGGAAGGGKSSALLSSALQYVDVPGYSALLLRRTFRDLGQPGALIPRSKDWLSNTDARWNDNDHRWTFPSTATLTFGYLQHEDDKYQYQGAEFQFVGFDELTQFTETQYTYLFSRCRRPRLTDDASDDDRARLAQLAQVPPRVRAASNPGGPGHEWVQDRFGLYRPEGEPRPAPLVCAREEWTGPVFIPARLDDNPHIDVESYEQNLNELDHHTRRQLRDGDWDSRPPGDLFRRGWFEVVDEILAGCRWVRFWDLAATEPSDSNPDPDYTVGMRVGRHPNGTLYIEDVVRLRRRPQAVEQAVQDAAERDGKSTTVWIEQEPGSAGKNTIDHYARTVLPAHAVKGRRSTGSKFERASVVSAKAEQGLVKIKRATWNAAFLSEVEAFTETDDHAHDDQVDTLSGAFAVLATNARFATERWRGATGGPPTVRDGDLVLVGEHHVDQ